ncbi:hypothetical protein BSKO_01665 [Bryopsis sp. KO-2023]|nr:hypothetical protein BSKO_01665 [Bryopsis sp. KO-2023]
MEVGLTCLSRSIERSPLGLLRACCSSVTKRLYVFVLDSPGPVTSSVLRCIEAWYGVVGTANPTLDVVPLFPQAGWSTNSVSALDVSGYLTANDQPLFDQWNTRRAKEGLPSIPILQVPFDELPQPDTTPPADVDEVPYRFDRVAVGGTFDRMHAGHRLLLSATALVSDRVVFLGITADKLLLKKNHKELLEPYDFRCQSAVDFIKSIRPSLEVTAAPLLDPMEPTAAETKKEMQALVVSEETISGGAAINEGRIRRGFDPLTIVCVGLVKGAEDSEKVSSTSLRAADAVGFAAGLRKSEQL